MTMTVQVTLQGNIGTVMYLYAVKLDLMKPTPAETRSSNSLGMQCRVGTMEWL